MDKVGLKLSELALQAETQQNAVPAYTDEWYWWAEAAGEAWARYDQYIGEADQIVGPFLNYDVGADYGE